MSTVTPHHIHIVILGGLENRSHRVIQPDCRFDFCLVLGSDIAGGLEDGGGPFFGFRFDIVGQCETDRFPIVIVGAPTT